VLGLFVVLGALTGVRPAMGAGSASPWESGFDSILASTLDLLDFGIKRYWVHCRNESTISFENSAEKLSDLENGLNRMEQKMKEGKALISALRSRDPASRTLLDLDRNGQVSKSEYLRGVVQLIEALRDLEMSMAYVLQRNVAIRFKTGGGFEPHLRYLEAQVLEMEQFVDIQIAALTKELDRWI